MIFKKYLYIVSYNLQIMHIAPLKLHTMTVGKKTEW